MNRFIYSINNNKIIWLLLKGVKLVRDLKRGRLKKIPAKNSAKIKMFSDNMSLFCFFLLQHFLKYQIFNIINY